MKKIFIFFILIIFFIQPMGFCDDKQSENAFEIPIDEVPPGGADPASSGLSSGAVTAIALGSVAGGLAAIGGIAYYFIHNGVCACLNAGQILCAQNPINSIKLDNTKFLEKIKTNPCKYNNLIKAIESSSINPAAEYVVIEDNVIKNKTYNTIFFKLPDITQQKTLNIKLTQISKPFSLNGKIPELDSKILTDADKKQANEISLYTSKIDPNSGILVKEGKINNFEAGKKYSVVTSLNSYNKNKPTQTYALLIEFLK